MADGAPLEVKSRCCVYSSFFPGGGHEVVSTRQFSLSNTFPIVLRRCTPTASTGPLPAPRWPLQAGDFCLKPELDSVCPCFTPSRVPPLQLSSLLVAASRALPVSCRHLLSPLPCPVLSDYTGLSLSCAHPALSGLSQDDPPSDRSSCYPRSFLHTAHHLPNCLIHLLAFFFCPSGL